MRISFSLLRIIIPLAIFVAGCSGNEQSLIEPEFSGLYMKAFMVDTLRMKVTEVVDEGEKILTNTLFSPGNRVSVSATYYHALHRIRVYNFYSNALLLDTPVSYRGTPFYIGFYQDQPGGQLQYIGPPVDEPLPDYGWMKISIIYTALQLPQSLKVVVENTLSETDNTYAPTDSFLLSKGVFSRYFAGRNLRSRKPRLSFYTTDGNETLVATASANEFKDTNLDFSTFLLGKASGSTVFALTSEKLY